MKKRKVEVVLTFQFMMSPALLYFEDECTEHEHYYHYAEEYFDNDETIKELTSKIYSKISYAATTYYEASYRVDENRAKDVAPDIIEAVEKLKKELSKYEMFEFKFCDYITNDYKKYLDK